MNKSDGNFDFEKLLFEMDEVADIVSAEDLKRLRRMAENDGIPVRNLELQLPCIWAGTFELIRKVGQGMSHVYLAEQLNLGRREVAVKIISGMSELETKMLLDESQSLGKLTKLGNPNIVVPIDQGVYQGMPYLVTEFVDGSSLNEMKGEPIGLAELYEIMKRVAFALEGCHRNGIIHGDLKPGNIMIDRAGNPKIIDFGLSGLSDASFFQELEFAGTAAYASPEQLRGDSFDFRSDIYSLGKVLGRLIERLELPAGNKIAKKLHFIEDRMCQDEADARYQSMELVAHEFDKLSGLLKKSTTRKSGLGFLWSILILTVALGGVCSVLYYSSKNSSNNLTRAQSVAWINGIGGELKSKKEDGFHVTVKLDRVAIEDSDLRKLSGIKDLEAIYLNETPITSEALQYLPNKIHVLYADNSKLSDDFCGTAVAQNRRFSLLGLNGNNITDKGVQDLAKMESISQLGLGNTRVTNNCVDSLTRLNKLFHLRIDGTKISDLGIQKICEKLDLQGLIISRCDISDDSMQALATEPNLTELILNDCPKITNRGVRQLASLDSLVFLSLEGNNLSPDGILHLANLPRLRKLFVGGCQRINLVELRLAFPEVEVFTERQFSNK